MQRNLFARIVDGCNESAIMRIMNVVLLSINCTEKILG